MRRETNIPLFLWVATALLAHILWGGGSDQVARVLEGEAKLHNFATAVRAHVNHSNRPFEVSLIDESELPESAEPRAEETPSDEEETPDDPQNPELKTEVREKPKSEQQTPPPPEPPKKEKPKEPPKIQVQKTPPSEPVKLPPNYQPRIAVEQHVQDKDQAPNPDAEFMGEHANRVKEQTQARITSTESNDPNPTPGQSHRGPTAEPGDSTVSELGQAEDQPGDLDKAPALQEGAEGNHKKAVEAKVAPRPATVAAGRAQQATASQGQKAVEGQAARQHRESVVADPELAAANSGAWYARKPAQEQKAQKAQKAIAQRQARPGTVGRLPKGLGSLGITPGGLNPNLTTAQAMAAIGQEQIEQAREADGERRRSKHRGSWQTVGLERWRSALENYVAGVKPGNQTALNTAASPFGAYLNRIHQRLHPQFAFRVLQQLSELPTEHPLNNMGLRTDLEIVLSGEDGRVLRMGVIRSSGLTAFDVEPLESVRRAAPFGAPPKEIISPDGKVYLHWGFLREPAYACSTYFARPYILQVAPGNAPPGGPERPAPENAPGQRHGRIEQQKKPAPHG